MEQHREQLLASLHSSEVSRCREVVQKPAQKPSDDTIDTLVSCVCPVDGERCVPWCSGGQLLAQVDRQMALGERGIF